MNYLVLFFLAFFAYAAVTTAPKDYLNKESNSIQSATEVKQDQSVEQVEQEPVVTVTEVNSSDGSHFIEILVLNRNIQNYVQNCVHIQSFFLNFFKAF